MFDCKRRFRYFLGLLLLISSSRLFSQSNMVTDGSIDSFTVNPLDTSMEYYITHQVGVHAHYWDELNTCQVHYFPEKSHDGLCFLLLTYYEPLGEYRKVFNVQAKLCRPLTKGSKYHLKFYAKIYAGNITVKSIGVSLSTSPFVNQLYYHKDESGRKLYQSELYEIEAGGFIMNKDSLYKFELDFESKGGEQYLLIGNLYTGEPHPRKRIPSFGYRSSVIAGSFVQYAISDITLLPLDTAEIPCLLPPLVGAKENPQFKIKPKGKWEEFANIEFGLGSSKVESKYKLALRSLAQVLLDDTLLLVSLTGYTDSVGSVNSNFALGYDRALSVRDELVASGISGKRIEVISKGEYQGINHVDTDISNARNRKVVISVGYFP